MLTATWHGAMGFPTILFGKKKMKLILEDEKELTSGSESLLPVPLLLHQHFREEKNMGGFQACQRHLQGMFVR